MLAAASAARRWGADSGREPRAINWGRALSLLRREKRGRVHPERERWRVRGRLERWRVNVGRLLVVGVDWLFAIGIRIDRVNISVSPEMVIFEPPTIAVAPGIVPVMAPAVPVVPIVACEGCRRQRQQNSGRNCDQQRTSDLHRPMSNS